MILHNNYRHFHCKLTAFCRKGVVTSATLVDIAAMEAGKYNSLFFFFSYKKMLFCRRRLQGLTQRQVSLKFKFKSAILEAYVSGNAETGRSTRKDGKENGKLLLFFSYCVVCSHHFIPSLLYTQYSHVLKTALRHLLFFSTPTPPSSLFFTLFIFRKELTFYSGYYNGYECKTIFLNLFFSDCRGSQAGGWCKCPPKGPELEENWHKLWQTFVKDSDESNKHVVLK